MNNITIPVHAAIENIAMGNHKAALDGLNELLKSLSAPTAEGLSAEESARWFDNNSDCYADTGRFENDGSYTEGNVIPAMTKQTFLQYASQLQSVPLVSAEEILAKHLGWDIFSSGPVMCNSNEIIAAMHEFRNQQPAVGMEGVEPLLKKWQNEYEHLNYKKDVPNDNLSEHGKLIVRGNIAAFMRDLKSLSPVVESKGVGIYKFTDLCSAILFGMEVQSGLIEKEPDKYQTLADQFLSKSTPSTSADAGSEATTRKIRQVENCEHDWIEYKQCCYCGGYENKEGAVIPPKVSKPHVMPSFSSPRNWTEDYKHENGNYLCKCCQCDEYFYGHKRRPLCKECSDKYDAS